MLTRLLQRRRSRRPQPGENQPQAAVPRHAARLFQKAEEALRRVQVPGYDVDLVASGIVRRMKLTPEGKLIVFLDYYGTDPSCFFCRFINTALWATILEKASKELTQAGIPRHEFRDIATGLLLEHHTRGNK